MIGSLDPAKILVILVIALIVLGPERLPKVARQAGAAWREFLRVRQEVTDEVRSALPDPADLPTIPRLPSVRGTLTRYISDDPAKAIGAGPDDAGSAAAAANGGDGTRRDPIPVARAESSAAALGEFVPPPDDPSMN
jgi:sec-independent protein translocase protein TatB